VLNSGEGLLAVSADGSLILLGDDVGSKAASRCLGLHNQVGAGGIRMPCVLGDALIRHFVLFDEICRMGKGLFYLQERREGIGLVG